MREIGLIQNLVEILDKLESPFFYDIEITKNVIMASLFRDNTPLELLLGEVIDRGDNTPNDLYLFQKKVQDFIVKSMGEK
jgi:hypothetical protein